MDRTERGDRASPGGLAVATRRAGDWCDESLDAHVRRQLARGWCIPACLAMLFGGGSERSERRAARALALDRPLPHALDLRDAGAYALLRSELERRGMKELHAPDSHALLRPEWLQRARKPVLVSVGYHAVICTGVRSASGGSDADAPAWRVLDPGNGRIAWRPLPRSGLAVEFAFA